MLYYMYMLRITGINSPVFLLGGIRGDFTSVFEGDIPVIAGDAGLITTMSEPVFSVLTAVVFSLLEGESLVCNQQSSAQNMCHEEHV